LALAYLDFFKASAENKDISQYVDAMIDVLKQLGLNTTLVKELADARKSLIKTLNDPKCVILKPRVDRFLEVLHRFYQSQPGLEYFPNTKKLRENPKNQDFFNLIDKLLSAIASLPQNPKSFTFDDRTATDIARVIFLASKLETRPPYSPSEKRRN
jgi:hypothetical protein